MNVIFLHLLYATINLLLDRFAVHAICLLNTEIALCQTHAMFISHAMGKIKF